jgi:hypothetical protein
MSPRKTKEIIFTHIEVDEEIPPGTRELCEEFVAESLFQMWLKEQSARFGDKPTKGSTPSNPPPDYEI